MRNTFSVLIAFVLAFGLWQCDDSVNGPGDEPTEPRPLTASEKDVASSSDEFGVNLFQAIIDDADAQQNVFISPLSVSVAFGMALNGARGETREEMAEVLGVSGLDEEQINAAYLSLIELLTQIDPAVVFEVANSIWPREGFPIKEDYLQVNREFFAAEVEALDYSQPVEAVNTINDWCCEKTHELICQPLQELDPMTIMVLVNAIYFKGDWTLTFEDSLTHEALFQLSDGSTAPCLLMFQESDFPYYANERFQVIDLPYGNGDFSMTVFLPKPDYSVDELIASLDVETYQEWLGNLSTTEVNLRLPKFTVECRYSLNGILCSMGMEQAFVMGRADFSGITDAADLFIDQVVHQTYCAVDEVGTEAAAVTAVAFGTTNAFGTYMRVDRPFMFVIRENSSGTILFAGRMMNPGMP